LTGCEDVPDVQRPRPLNIDREDEWCGWDGVALTVKVSADGPTTRIAVTVPKSVVAALKLVGMKHKRTEGEIVTEALIRFLSAPIGTFPPKQQRKGGIE
jgi:hypothetical protein